MHISLLSTFFLHVWYSSIIGLSHFAFFLRDAGGQLSNGRHDEALSTSGRKIKGAQFSHVTHHLNLSKRLLRNVAL
jgi:hypothetical protein